MQQEQKFYHGGPFTIIDIIFLCIFFMLIVIPTMPAYKYGGLILAIPVAIASLCGVIALCYCIGYILKFLFPLLPDKCETGKCVFFDGLHERIGLEGAFAIFYFRCHCGYEYIQTNGFLAKIKSDGSLQPYKLWRCLGMRNDSANSEVANYRVEPELLEKLRRLEDNSEPDESISKDATLNEILQKLNTDQ